MNTIKILDIILIVLLLLFGIEFMVTFKKSENKNVEEIRDSLIKRLNIIMFLIASVGIVTLVNIFMNK